MMAGIPFLAAMLYCTLAVATVMTLIEVDGGDVWRHIARRWGKFLLLLVVLGAVVEGLAMLQG